MRTSVCARAHAMLERQAHPDAPALCIDGELPFTQNDPGAHARVDRLRPFGERNERPVFLSCGLRLPEPPRIVGADGTHAQLRLRSGANELKAMAFGQAHRMGESSRMGVDVHAVFTPKWNTWRGETKLEVELLDFRTGPPPSL